MDDPNVNGRSWNTKGFVTAYMIHQTEVGRKSRHEDLPGQEAWVAGLVARAHVHVQEHFKQGHTLQLGVRD